MNPAVLVPTIPVEELLEAYNEGRFPMCHEDSNLYWHDPDPRAVFPLQALEPNERTLRALRSKRFTYSKDSAFNAVIEACAEREETWLDHRLIASYQALHAAGFAHSVEVWEEGRLVGGIYGVALGGAFFGESMFNRVPNAGKLAFYTLLEHLKQHGFTLFDTQYINAFTAQLGAVEVRCAEFRRTLAQALPLTVKF